MQVSNILIGKDIDRSASPVLRGNTQSVQDGEIFVLDDTDSIASAGTTIADTEYLRIAQVIDDTLDYTTPGGTAVEENKMIVSNPIYGAGVKKYKGISYTAPTEQVSTLTPDTPVVGDEYVVRLVYTDKASEESRDGQFVQEWRATATSTTKSDLVDLFKTQINGDSDARVTASGTSTLILTAQTPTETLNSLPPYKQVQFDPYYTTGDPAESAGTWAATTPSDKGHGSWREIRDMEYAYKGYRGLINRNAHKQLIGAADTTWYTVKNETYDQITIMHDTSYTPAGLNKKDVAPLSTVIAIPKPGSGSQMTNVLAVLNPYMASCPGAFASVSV